VVYTGRDGSFSLYEDENGNYNYEKGAFSWIPFTYSESTKTLGIGKCQGEFPGMLKERTFEVVWLSKDSASPLNLDGAPAQTVTYRGEPLTVVR
jgi:alpha-D-xyloside xylohydrolase